MGIDEDPGRKCYDNLSNHAHVEGLGLGLVFFLLGLKQMLGPGLMNIFKNQNPLVSSSENTFKNQNPMGSELGQFSLIVNSRSNDPNLNNFFDPGSE